MSELDEVGLRVWSRCSIDVKYSRHKNGVIAERLTVSLISLTLAQYSDVHEARA